MPARAAAPTTRPTAGRGGARVAPVPRAGAPGAREPGTKPPGTRPPGTRPGGLPPADQRARRVPFRAAVPVPVPVPVPVAVAVAVHGRADFRLQRAREAVRHQADGAHHVAVDGGRASVGVEEGGDRGEDPLEGGHHLGIELGPAAAADLLERELPGLRLLVAARLGDGVEGIDDREDARAHGDLVGAQPVGVALAVEPLVVVPNDRARALEDRELAGDLLPLLGVLAHDRPLRGRELAGLAAHVRRDTSLADVVEDRPELDVEQVPVIPDAHLLGHDRGVLADAVAVVQRLGALIELRRESDEHRAQHLTQLRFQTLLVLLAKRPSLADREGPLHGLGDVGQREGLREEVAGAEARGFGGVVDVVERRDDHARRPGRHVRLDLLQELDPVAARHPDVGDDEVVLGPRDQILRHQAVRRLVGAVSQLLESPPEQLADVGFVLDDQDVRHELPRLQPRDALPLVLLFRPDASLG